MLPKCLTAAALSVAVSMAALPADAETYTNPHLLVSVDELAGIVDAVPADIRALDMSDVVIIDVRPAADYAEGHIPGARQIEPDAVADPSSPIAGALRPAAELAAMIGALGIAPETEVVLYDGRGGFHASRMFWLLEYMGHQHVSLLNGGIQSWVAAGHAVETGADDAEPGAVTFAPALTPRRHATADWILERQHDDNTLVIDVRPTQLYEQGHIPWAHNIPWSQNLNEDKTMLSADALRAHFEALGVTPDRNIVVHCQNGLASSHTYFALRLLGYPQVRTYHRSWSEWGIADDLPRATADAG